MSIEYVLRVMLFLYFLAGFFQFVYIYFRYPEVANISDFQIVMLFIVAWPYMQYIAYRVKKYLKQGKSIDEIRKEIVSN